MVFLYMLIPCWFCGIEDNGQCEGDMLANLLANPTGACAVGSSLVELLNSENIKNIHRCRFTSLPEEYLWFT